MAFGIQPMDAGGVPLWTPSPPGAKRLPPLLRIEKPALVWRRPPVSPPAPWPRTSQRYRRAVVNIIAGDVDADHLLTRENHARYAKACGAEYLVLREPKQPHNATSWKYRVGDIAKDFDQTLYLDSDCVVTRWAPNVFERVPMNCWGVVDELPYLAPAGAAESKRVFGEVCQAMGRQPISPRFTINGGVLMCPPDAAHVYRLDYADNWLADQTGLSVRLHDREAEYRLLDYRWNCNWMMDRRVWNTPRVFIRHRAGQQWFEGLEAKLTGIAEDLAREGW